MISYAEWEKMHDAQVAQRKAEKIRKRAMAALQESISSIVENADPGERDALIAESVAQCKTFLQKNLVGKADDDDDDAISDRQGRADARREDHESGSARMASG
jgi:hypothetical protein